MKLSEIKTLDQLQLELCRNGFIKAKKHLFDMEVICPEPGEYAINYVTAAVPHPWEFEPRIDLVITPRNESYLHKQGLDIPPYPWKDKFYLSAVCLPTIESMNSFEGEFGFEKWTWGEGTKVKPNYPSGKIERWILVNLITKDRFNGLVENEFEIDNLEKSLLKFLKSFTDLEKLYKY
tara:strand:- start:174 stop:707 length:534 start_codon:yes stop_codon:yes gene_type:complete